MAPKNLLIVESPGKIKTLSRFLGSDFVVEASKGHVVDLPESRLGVDVEKGFAPAYGVVRDKEEVIRRLQNSARGVERIYLAPDPDREGEAISWHLANLLNIDPMSECRVTFNAITKDEVLRSIQNPRPIDLSLVSAQQSRRILDRLVGYKLSPLLWKKVRMGLSAGRVQSVAVLVVCDREREILAFTPVEYWTIKTLIKPSEKQVFEAKLIKIDGKKAEIPNQARAEEMRAEIENNPIRIEAVNRRERKQTPPPPFITSTLQQEASHKFSLTSKRTMSIAQRLYEGVELGSEGHVGLITYMRTDSVRIAPEGLTEAHEYITKRYGPSYALLTPRAYKSRKGSQDAHEAIRPTSVWRTPEVMSKSLSPEELKLYTLIWKRFVATQMAEAIYDVVSLDIRAARAQLQAVGTTMKFDGFTSLYTESRDESEPAADPAAGSAAEGETEPEDKQRLPEVTEETALSLQKLDCRQNFTQPPPRFSESMLIKTLEKEGIGRPSTYATIVETIQQRGYVRKVEGRFQPLESAFLAIDILTSSFGDVISPSFTATMESKLDGVEEGSVDWVKLLQEFYTPFLADLKRAETTLKKAELPSDCVCPKCGKPMLVKLGRSGKFLACSGYPECKSTENIPEEIPLFLHQPGELPLKLRELLDKHKLETEATIEVSDQTCALCGGSMVVKSGRFGKFLACSKYPECRGSKPIVQGIGVMCPAAGCGGQMVIKRSKTRRVFYGCSNYPNCQVVTWSPPTGDLCPECRAPLVKHSTKKLGEFVKCSNKTCSYKLMPQGENGAQEK